jgi:DNA-binding CsgD family transcriptional regulator
MLMTITRHNPDQHREENKAATCSANHVDQSLAEALTRTLDNIAVGVVIVGDDLRILHANHAARHMFGVRSPIVSLGGHLAALRADLTNELKQAIAHVIQSGYRQSGIGLPLVNRDMTAAAAHVMPLNSCASLASSTTQAVATIFVTSASKASQVDLSTVGRTFRLTPVEGRLLRHLVSGRTLREAADALGVTEAAAASLQSDIFAKVGVSRLTDLMILIGHLVPPIFQAQCF